MSDPSAGPRTSPGTDRSSRESDWRLKSIIEGTNVGSWEWNVQTGETRFNERWAEIIGYTLDELGPVSIETWMHYCHPDDLALSEAALEAHFSGEADHYDVECRMRHRDGHWVWVHDRGRVFSWATDGAPEWMFGTHQDVSDRKRAEETQVRLERQVLQAQKLESLGVLAGGIAHDFNNILGAIRGNVDLSLMEVDDGSRVAGYLKEIVEGVERASLRTRQILAYSGQSDFTLEPLNLSELLNSALELLRPSLDVGTTMALDLETDLPPILADGGQMQQVAVNLVTNGFDALEGEGGVVTVATGAMTWSGRDREDGFRLQRGHYNQPAPGPCVFMEVTDTGTGVTDRTLARIFEPFFTTRFQGRGLGLAVVEGILRTHGGGLLVRTAPGGGSTFRVFFPALSTAEHSGGGRSESASVGEELLRRVVERRALVVDDEAAFRTMCVQALTSLGMNVQAAENGREALQTLEGGSFDAEVVLLDVVMPDMDGLACLRQMREKGLDVPVILMSGFTEDRVQGGRLPAGVAFLEKPFAVPALLRAVATAVEGGDLP